MEESECKDLIVSKASIQVNLAQYTKPAGWSNSVLNELTPQSVHRVKIALNTALFAQREHLIIGRVLGDLLSTMPETLPYKAQVFKHYDDHITMALASDGWSLEIMVSLSQNERSTIQIDDHQVYELGYIDGGIGINEQRQSQWLRAINLLGRAKVFGVAEQPTEAIIDENAQLHPTVEVAGAVEVGAHTKIWHFSKLLGPLKIGESCSFGQNVVIEKGVEIGRNVKVQNNVSIYAGVILEDDVFCGPSMVFTNVGTPRSHYPRRNAYSITRVGRGASIGANATVVCGHSLGRYSFVGAGAVVTKDVPDFALVYGNPARVRGWACYCGQKLKFEEKSGQQHATCEECNRNYRLEGELVTPLSPLD